MASEFIKSYAELRSSNLEAIVAVVVVVSVIKSNRITMESLMRTRLSKRTKPKPSGRGENGKMSPLSPAARLFLPPTFSPPTLLSLFFFLPSLLSHPSSPSLQEQLHIGSLDQPSSSFSVLIICVSLLLLSSLKKPTPPASRAYLRKKPSRWSSKSTLAQPGQPVKECSQG